jgi:hypothetical protein
MTAERAMIHGLKEAEVLIHLLPDSRSFGPAFG